MNQKMFLKYVPYLFALFLLVSLYSLGPINLNDTDEIWTKAVNLFLTVDSKKDDPGYSRWQKEQTMRKARIQQTCDKYGSVLLADVDKHWITYDKKDGILNCRLSKMASSTIFHHFFLLTPIGATNENLSQRGQIDAVVKYFSIQDSEVDLRKLVSETVSFTFVRHPFERLVSAFQFLVVDDAGNGIRGRLKNAYPKDEPNFPNFIRWILKDIHSNCRNFTTCNCDTHWMPYTARCGHCDLQYNVIGKLETMEEDLYYIGKVAGVQFGTVSNHHLHQSSGGNTSNLTRQYFGQVDKNLLNQLYAVYQVDFEMFGYSMIM